MICMQCKSEINSNARFCRFCGAQVANHSTLITCFECGKKVSDRAEECPHCGYPLKNITASTDPSNPHTFACNECGMKISHDAPKCPQCGCPTEEPIAFATTAQKPVKRRKWGLWIVVFSVIGVVIYFIAQGGLTAEVITGTKVNCSICQKELSNNIHRISVPFWKKDEYRAYQLYDYCDRCGNEEVAYTINYVCERCGKVISSNTQFAARKLNNHDQTYGGGFCSKECEILGKIESGIDKGSEKTGEILGRIGKGLLKGLSK